ncbi:regulator [Caldiplasma sukawensis]
MWKLLNDEFGKYSSQMKVVKFMIEYGFSVKEKFDNEYSMFSGPVEVRPSALAIAINVDKRVVNEVMKKILSKKNLFEFFQKLQPIADVSSASSKMMGYGVIEIIPEDATKSGIISGVISSISKRDIGIRQVIVQDPEIHDDPRARIVTDSQLPPELIMEIKNLKGVKGVLVL